MLGGYYTRGGATLQSLNTGSIVKIASYKHDGTIHRIWQENTILSAKDNQIIGVNDETMVIENDGRQWLTKDPGVFYFSKEWWFNIIGLLQGDDVYYYCNLSSPFVYRHKTIKYIDYDLDIKVYPDLTYRIVDHADYERHKKQMNYPRDLTYILQQSIDELVERIEQKREPFSPNSTRELYEQYLNMANN